jgi:hypothetical protein
VVRLKFAEKPGLSARTWMRSPSAVPDIVPPAACVDSLHVPLTERPDNTAVANKSKF